MVYLSEVSGILMIHSHGSPLPSRYAFTLAKPGRLSGSAGSGWGGCFIFSIASNMVSCSIVFLRFGARGWHLIPPRVPPGSRLSGEKLDPGQVSHQLDDPVAHFVWLLAMLPQRAENELTDSCTYPFRLSFHSQKARLRVSPCPAAESEKVAVSAAVLLYPLEGDALVGEAPRLDHFEGFAQHRICGPHKQNAVIRSNTPPPQH